MEQIIIAGIRRKNMFSPNHIGNDAAVFDATVAELRAMGCVVNEYAEPDFIEKGISEKAVFTMGRDFATLERLTEMEDSGCTVVNSGYGILNCMRERMTNLLIQNNIPHPESVVVDTDKNAKSKLQTLNSQGFWLKRADCHAIHHEDVCYA